MAVASLVMVPFGSLGSALVVVNVFVLVVALVDFVAAPSPASVSVAREFPAAITMGHPGEVAWRVRHERRGVVRAAIADSLAPSLHADQRRFSVDVPPRTTATVTVGIRPSRRGRIAFDEIVVRTAGPLRLLAKQRRRSSPEMMRVLPPFRSKDEAELSINRARILEVGLRSAQGRGGGTEFEQLREYSTDDEFRRIDWSATARTGRAIVKTYRAERNQTVICLLDNGRVMAGRVGDVPRVEHAMDAVMMMTAVATRLGDRTGLVAFDRTVRSIVTPAKGRDQLARVTEAMYDLHPVLFESDYRGAFTATLARFRRRALLVVLTELSEAAVAENFLPALPVVARSHVVIVAAVRDPDVERWANAVPNDPEEAYRKAAAVRALDERRRTTVRLRALGVTVIDAPPGELARKLADAYLKVKATGRL